MPTGNTISLRLTLDGAVALRQQLEDTGNNGGAALDKLRSALERINATTDGSAALAASLQRVTQVAQQAQAALGQTQANSFAGVTDPTDYKARSADVAAYGASLDALRARYSPLFAASKEYESQLDGIAAAEKVGAISANEAAAARDNATAAFAKSSAPITAASGALDQHTTSSKAASQATRELSIQFTQAVSGIATGQPIFATLVQQGHQVYDSMAATGQGFGELGAAAKGMLAAVGGLPTLIGVGVVGAFAALTVASNSSVGQFNALQTSLRGAHDNYQSLAQSVEDAAKRVSASSGLGFTEALETAKTIASGKYFSGTATDLERLTIDAANMGAIMGGGAAAGAKALLDAQSNVTKVAQDLSATFANTLTPEVLKHIEATERAAGSGKAYQELLTALEATMKGAAHDGLSPLAQGWQDLGNAFTGSTKGWQPFLAMLSTTGEAALEGMANKVRALRSEFSDFDTFVKQHLNTASSDSTRQLLEGGHVVGVPFGQSSNTTSAPAISQVDATLRPLVEAAANQNQLDAEILARLQLAENAKPTGYDASGAALYAASGENSPNAAVGAFQVKPSTYAGLGLTGDPSSNANNTNAAATLFSHLLDKYGDVQIAVLAYHDGETLMDKVLAGGGNVSNSQDAINEALKVTQGYSGNGRAASAAVPPITVTAGSSRRDQDASDTASASILDQSKRTIDDATATANALNLVGESRNKLIQQQQLFEAALTIPNQTPEEIGKWNAALAATTGALNQALTPAQAYIQSLKDQAAPTAALTAGDKLLADVKQHIAEIERSSGTQFTDAEKQQAYAAAIAASSGALKGLNADLTRQIGNQNDLAAAYGQGGDAVLQATAKQQAYQFLLSKFPQDNAAIQAALPNLTQKYLDVAKAADNVKLAQQSLGIEDNVKLIQAQTASLGENEDQRNRDLAVLQAEIPLHLQVGQALTAEQQHYVDLVGKQADYTTALKSQQAALSELSGFFDNTFSTISDAIVSAFATGEQSAVKFKDVVASVEQAIEAEFLKLALINPLKNWLLGDSTGSSPTLLSVGGVIGQLLGNSSTGVGSSTTSTAAGVSALESLGFVKSLSDDSASTLAAANNNSSSGATTSSIESIGKQLLGGGIGGLADKIAYAVTEAIGNTQTAADILSAAGATNTGSAAILGASVGNAAGLSDGAAASLASAASSVASAVPYIGAAVSVISSFASGDYRAAGLEAGGALTGAAIGSLIGTPGIGTAVGAAVGGLISAILPNHPLNPYQNVQLNVAGGHLAAGASVGQIEDVNSTQNGVQSYADSINAYLDQVGIVITAADGHLGDIGDHITGLAQTLDPNTLFARLSFKDATNDGSNFSVAKGALSGLNFNTPQDLANELSKIAGFADAASAIGVQLKAVGSDLTNIQIASVQQDAGGLTTVQDASGNNVSFNADLRQALQSDLPSQSFANVQALDDEINKVNTYLTSTLPQLLTPTVQTTSSTSTARAAVDAQYEAGIGQDQALGLGNTAALTTAWQQAIALVMKPAVAAWTTTLTSIAGRSQTLLYGQSGAGSATLNNLAQTQAAERQSFEDQARQTWGDAAVSTANYQAELQQLIETQNAETLATQQQVQAAKDQSASTLFGLEAQNAQAAGVDSSAVQMQALIAQQAQAGDQFVADWVSYYGQASLSSAAFQQQQQIEDEANYKARLDLQNSFNGQSAAQLATAQSSVTSLFTSIHDYAVKLQTGDNSPLSPLDQYDLAKSQFNAVSGAAAAGDANSASELTSYADALISTSRAVNGSGTAYATDVNQVLDALQGVVSNPDALTQSFMTQALQTQTAALQDSIASLQAEVTALRKEMQTQTRALAA